MNRRLVAAPVLALALTLGACAGGGETAESATPSGEATAGASSTADTTGADTTGDATTDATGDATGDAAGSATGDAALAPLADLISDPAAPDMTKDDAGVVAFLTYFVDEMNRAYGVPDPAALDGLCAADADHCAAIAEGAQALIDNDYTAYGGLNWLGTESMVIAWPDEDTATVTVPFHQDAAEIRDSSGTVIDSSEDFEMDVTYTLGWQDGRWVVENAEQATS